MRARMTASHVRSIPWRSRTSVTTVIIGSLRLSAEIARDVSTRRNHAARDTRARVTGGIAHVVVCPLVNDEARAVTDQEAVRPALERHVAQNDLGRAAGR